MSSEFPGEILDLVDQNDRVIGNIDRNEAYMLGVTNFRVIDALIKNSCGQLFIPRRHSNKRLFPQALDSSVGGHVTSGDSYDETLAREALEELNLVISDFPYQIIGSMNPHEDGVAAFIKVYEINSDVTPQYNLEDFVEHFWLTPHEIIERVEKGDRAKPHLIAIIKRFYL